MLKLICAEKSSNWDLYADDKNYLWSVPNEKGIASGAKGSHFGNIHHVRGLISRNQFNFDTNQFTEEGLELFSGLYSHFIFNDDMTIKFSLTSFYRN